MRIGAFPVGIETRDFSLAGRAARGRRLCRR